MGTKTIYTCDLDGCYEEKEEKKFSTEWIAVCGQIWSHGHRDCPNLEMRFCSWKHFEESCKRGFKK